MEAPGPFAGADTRAPRQPLSGPPLRPRAPEGLYAHVPFCVSRCPDCDFVVFAGAATRGPRNRMAELLGALHRELDLRADLLDEAFGAPCAARPPLGSLYLGGGTPSLLQAGAVAALVEHVDRRLGLAPGAEVTLEANPGPDELGDLAGFRAAGVTRLSIGAQSMDASELRTLGRRHSPGDVAVAVHAARRAGIGSVSLDLLTDLPDQTLSGWRRTLGMALELEPDHVSVYALALDDPDGAGLTGATGDHLPLGRGARAWRDRVIPRQSEDRAADMEAVSEELLAAAGLRRYEIANWARPGHAARHNLLYWRRRPYLAIGPGAHGSDGGLERTWNAAALDAYLGALAADEAGAATLPPGGREVLGPHAAVAEEAMLGLRLHEGIDPVLAGNPSVERALAWGAGHGLVERDAHGARLTARGRLLAGEVFVRLLPDDPAPQARATRTSMPADG
ncbi:radical SAM family heme chaperone HemW [soil metagenome]